MIRDAIAENETTWRRVRKNKRFCEAYTFYDDRLKTAPRGYAKDHPQVDELRLKSFLGMAKLSRKQIESPELLQTIPKLVSAAKPLMVVLCETLGQPY